MTDHRTWRELTAREKEQVQLILFSMKELSYGVNHLDQITSPDQPITAETRFYMTSLHQYCANYFLVTGANKLRDVLVQLGSGDLLEPIDGLLATPLGDSTFGEILKAFRNKFLTHQSFTFAPMEKAIHTKFDLDDPSNSAQLTDLIEKLFRRTQQLYGELGTRFSEAFGA